MGLHTYTCSTQAHSLTHIQGAEDGGGGRFRHVILDRYCEGWRDGEGEVRREKDGGEKETAY